MKSPLYKLYNRIFSASVMVFAAAVFVFGSSSAFSAALYLYSGSSFSRAPFCTPITPCAGPFAGLTFQGCGQAYCGPKQKREPFCMYDNDPCAKQFCKAKRIDSELNDLRCQVQDGHMFAAVRLGHMFLIGDGVCKDLNFAFCWYKKAAEACIPVAQIQMGHFYRDGCVVPRDICQAMTWYKRAADQGDVGGLLALAEMYKGWHGVKPDRAKALALYKKAAACGSADAEYEAGLLLMRASTGKGTETGIEKLLALAEEGHPDSMTAIGDAYYEGRLGPRDITKAYFYWNKGAKAGSALGAFKLAMAYSSCECQPRNPCAAAEWFRIAANRGLPEAELMMGNLYRDGHGVPKDLSMAAEWYFRATKHDVWRAQLELADFYHAGKGGLPRFLEEAARRYNIASNVGDDAYASLMLSIMYEDGRGVPQDLAKSVAYYDKARCQPGFLQALYKIGRRYALGYGLPKSMTLAIRWYCRAADYGLAVAQVELGDIHYFGECVPQDFGAAFEWYHKAAVCGHSYAQNMLGLILLEGDCLPKYANTVVAGFRFQGKVTGPCDKCCIKCKQTICVCEPAYSEKAGNACALCPTPECDKRLQVECHCSPCTACNCGARNVYRCVAWCKEICGPKHKYCGKTPGRCTVAISKENARRAAKWIHRAAISGAGQAQFQLGILYMTGIGVPRDEAKAYAWLHTALEGMDDKNPDIINCLIDQMSPQMRQRAVCLAERAKCYKSDVECCYPSR